MTSKSKVETGAVKSKKSDALQGDLDRTGMLGSERNRLYTLCLLLLIGVIVLALKLVAVAESSASNHKVAWVKMYANGTWDVVLHDNQEPQQFMQHTVDSILSQWVNRRYSERPNTVRTDYGYASDFMSEKKKGEFVDSKAFNAPAKAAEILSCKTCDVVEYKVGPIDHFDVDVTTFSERQNEVYQTNVFADRILETSAGQQKDKDKRIVRIQWRLMEPSEIQQISRREGGLEWLRSNPIGLEIIDYQELNDPSDK